MTNHNDDAAAKEKNASLAAAVRLLSQSQHIAAATHVTPDPDAIGSLLGFGHAMRQLGKDILLLCDDPAPRSVRFLPGADSIQSAIPANHPIDLFVGLDASDA